MPNPSFKPNRRGLDELQKALQKELNKRPVRIPVEADPAPLTPRSASATSPTVQHQTIYNGPVVTMSGDHAQLAWSETGDVTQQQTHAVADGYDRLALILADVLARLDALPLNDPDREDAAVGAREVLAEVVKEAPDAGVVRRGARTVRGVLEGFSDGVGSALGQETFEWLSTTVEQLAAAVPG